MATYKTIPDLDKITAAEISTKSNYSVEVGQNTDVNKESKGMNLDELQTLIGGGGGGGTSIEDAAGTTGLYTEETANRLVGHSANTGTSLIFEMFEGTGTPVSVFQIDGNGNLFNNANYNLVKDAYNNTFISTAATHAAVTASSSFNIAIGNNALASLTSSDYTIAIGYGAGDSVTTGSQNVLIGYNAGATISTSIRNVIIGDQAGLQSTGERNTFLGYNAAQLNTGSNNTCIGYISGFTGDGSNCVFLGYGSGAYSTASNRLIIDNQVRTNEATELTDSLIVGEFNATKASQWLQVNGNLKTYGRQPNLDTQTGTFNPTTYNITALDEYLLLEGTPFALTVNLPTISSSNHGKIYKFKCIDATATVTISTDGSDTLDEAAATSETLNLNDKRVYIADNNSSKWIRLN